MKKKLRKIIINDQTYLWRRQHIHNGNDENRICVEKVTIFHDGISNFPFIIVFDNQFDTKWRVDQSQGLLIRHNLQQNKIVFIDTVNLNKPSSIKKIILFALQQNWKPKEKLGLEKKNGLDLIDDIEFPPENPLERSFYDQNAKKRSAHYYEQIESIARKLEKLQKKDDNYQLNPVLSESYIATFENEHQIYLPIGYRLFLTHIGNGGSGPYFGLQPLEMGIYGRLEMNDYVINLNKPFRHEKFWNFTFQNITEKEWDDFYAKNETEYYHKKWLDGFLTICDFGCGIYMGLVVSGTAYGDIWVDDRANTNGIYPDMYFDQKENEKTSFLDWYEMWLDKEIIELF